MLRGQIRSGRSFLLPLLIALALHGVLLLLPLESERLKLAEEVEEIEPIEPLTPEPDEPSAVESAPQNSAGEGSGANRLGTANPAGTRFQRGHFPAVERRETAPRKESGSAFRTSSESQVAPLRGSRFEQAQLAKPSQSPQIDQTNQTATQAPQAPQPSAESPSQTAYYLAYARLLEYQRLQAARQRTATQQAAPAVRLPPQIRSNSSPVTPTQQRATSNSGTVTPTRQRSTDNSSPPSPQQHILKPTERSLKPTLTDASHSSKTFSQSFPYYLGSFLASGGLLKSQFDRSDYVYHTTDNLEKVADHFESQLAKRGFTQTLETEQENLKVYQVSKKGETQFLHLFSEDGKTAILLSPEAQKQEELKSNNQEAKSAWLTKLKFYFAFKDIKTNPELGLEDLNSDFEGDSQLKEFKNIERQNKFLFRKLKAIAPANLSPDQLATKINRQLTTGENAFNLEKVAPYAGGDLYKITQADFEAYIVFVPMEKRTAILFSETAPRP